MSDRCPTCGKTRTRSSEQSRMYWALIAKLVPFHYNGKRWTKLQWHDYMKDMFLQPEVRKLPDGRTVVREPTSRGLGVDKFSKFYTCVEVWCAERDIYLEEMVSD